MENKTDTYTHYDIATHFDLWGQYVDPLGIDSLEEFHAMTMATKLGIIAACFGEEGEQ